MVHVSVLRITEIARDTFEVVFAFPDPVLFTAGQYITMNRKTHAWLPEYIDEVRIKYVVELGKGKLKKDGTKGKSGGTIHLHVYLSVYHHSNISLEWEALRDFFEPPMFQYFALKPFISRPRLVQPDRVEEYMEKSFQRAAWQTIDLV
jgi:hypothetical protein